METIDLISTLTKGGLRLDFPTEKRLAALAMAWDDGANHQVAFLRKERLGKASAKGEYASMLASADLLLPIDSHTVGLATEPANPVFLKREIAVPQHRKDYVDLYLPFESIDKRELVGAFHPLSVLSTILSALELRGGSAFVIGGRPAILQAAEANLKSTFPRLRIVGRLRGDYLPAEEGAVMQAVQKSAPDLILVGSLVRGDELWIPRHMRYTRSGLYLYDPDIVEVLAGRP
jgi:N-acetylglucosaminyldiphosphoundecaprenol N-acetyl-beta-D-mannosaminyltransferase